MTGLTLLIDRKLQSTVPTATAVMSIVQSPMNETNLSPLTGQTSTNIQPPLRFLAEKNAHPRDSKITFEEEGHKYTIEGMDKAPTSVTTLIHHNFPVFNADLIISKMMKSRNWPSSKYFGKTKEEIKAGWESSGKEASHLGTLMHADIERFFNREEVLNPNTKEFSHFLLFWGEFQRTNPGFYPCRTEWLVYYDGIAGSIDFIVENAQGQIIILDWKRSGGIKMDNQYEKGLGPFAHLDNCNFWHYSLQLNIYRHILETKYNKQVVGMYIVVLHPDNPYYLTHLISHYDIASIWDTLNEQTHHM